MRFVIFGLTLSSSWGNGHATLWRGLLRALARRGHRIIFFEKDVAYYANTRDGWEPPAGVHLHLYDTLESIRSAARLELQQSDVAIVTSYCPEGAAVARLLIESAAWLKVFYDMDTPVTLDALRAGEPVSYLPEEGLAAFDLVLSYTGGRALDELHSHLGARRVLPLYGWVDPEVYRPALPMEEFRCALSYLGTFASDRQPALEELLMRPAQLRPAERFVIGGAQYPESFPWMKNLYFVRHLPPALHPSFFCSGRATLNITRRAMAQYGFCPSGRLFEAAACGAPILTDTWQGLNKFFVPGEEVLPVASTDDVLRVLSLSDRELRMVAEAGRNRTLEKHTASNRAIELENLLAAADTSVLTTAAVAQ